MWTPPTRYGVAKTKSVAESRLITTTRRTTEDTNEHYYFVSLKILFYFNPIISETIICNKKSDVLTKVSLVFTFLRG